MGSLAALIVGSLICHGTWTENAHGDRELTLASDCEITQAQCMSAAAEVETEEHKGVVARCSADMHTVLFLSNAEARSMRSR